MDGSKEELKRIVLGKIREDPLAADLRWSFFVAACNNYRYDTVLRPFPPMFMDEHGEKDIETLKSVVDEIPGILQLAAKVGSFSYHALELMAWVLDDPTFKFHTLNKSQYNTIKKKTGHTTAVPEPSYIFEVEYSQPGELRFKCLSEGRKITYAYHGSRIENFHSILHNGLANHMNKVSLFGRGIYLSSELAVSLIYSPGGQGWKESQMGPNLGCVAVCQIIDDPSVKCNEKTGKSQKNSRARASESQAGDVPEKYYVVENNKMVRVKYLLVYCQPAGAPEARSAHIALMPWYRRNKFAVLMAIYLFVLMAVGLFSSKTFHFQFRRLLRSYGLS